jgi:hypothetical protein
MPLEPGAVDERLVVARVAGVHAVPLAQGHVLLHDVGGVAFVVNPTGALVWEFLDGSSSLAEICRDLADGFSAPRERVLADTLALVRQMAERGLVRDAADSASEPAVLERVAARGRPSVAERTFTAEPWGAISVRAGTRLRSLAVTDREMFELARSAIVPDRLVDDPAPPDLRLLVSPARGAIPGMHALYREGRCVLRATGDGRMVRAALLHLGALAPDPEGTVRLHSRVLVGPRGITLVAGTHLEVLDLAAPRLGRLGLRVLDVPGPLVDPVAAQVVVPDAPDFLDPRGLAEIDRRYPRNPSEEAVAPGRYEIADLVIVGVFGPDDPSDAATRAELCTLLVGPDGTSLSRDQARVVELLAERLTPRWIVGFDDRELLDVVEQLAGQPSAFTGAGGPQCRRASDARTGCAGG